MPETITEVSKHKISFRYAALAVILTSTSGAAILAHVFGPVPMVLTAPFIVLPSTLLILGFVLWKRHRYRQFNILAGRLVAAGTAGFIATLAYDLVRPALVAGFVFGCSVLAVEYFREDAGAGGFAHTPRTGEEKSMRNMATGERVFEGSGHMALPHHVLETLGTVFTRGNYKIAHVPYLLRCKGKMNRERRGMKFSTNWSKYQAADLPL